jgi:uncharacterized protein YrzB (UPF0473 family)
VLIISNVPFNSKHPTRRLELATCGFILALLTAGCANDATTPKPHTAAIEPGSIAIKNHTGVQKLVPESETEAKTIIVTGEDGVDYRCQVLRVINFENKEYVLLQKLSQSKPTKNMSPDSSVVIMRLNKSGTEGVFSNIQDDSEFERVSKYTQRNIVLVKS